MSDLHVGAVCAGILALLVFGLGLGVSIVRGRTNRVAGYTDDPSDPLYKWVRAHGNATEYNPILALLVLYVESASPASWVLWVFVIATLARVLHAAGMILSPTLAQPQPLRAIGAVGTYVCGIALAVIAMRL
jgi:uncharacterized membrane protein YecN with MAPEG domain